MGTDKYGEAPGCAKTYLAKNLFFARKLPVIPVIPEPGQNCENLFSFAMINFFVFTTILPYMINRRKFQKSSKIPENSSCSIFNSSAIFFQPGFAGLLKLSQIFLKRKLEKQKNGVMVSKKNSNKK